MRLKTQGHTKCSQVLGKEFGSDKQQKEDFTRSFIKKKKVVIHIVINLSDETD